ncbi:hypothetical protein F4556_004056 [Kitasatospora gansuensis]|uniref:Tail terminator n=1 Tax=Kitasatospora gansuensis TaxID=258050 RepID=A0A7W7SFU2_9ACTN|nr:hypothetical protein [Kitasatospora gansuensis]MBB4948521.1 hypothetical protein [Kitasatospora gansuensis]
MSGPVIAFPDVERVVVDSLKNRPELTGVTVDNKPPAGFDGTQKAVLVSRVGGAWLDDQFLDRPLVDLEVYGPDKTTAHGIALAARSLVLQLGGTAAGTGTVTDVAEADGPRWLPDFNRPAASRYISTVRLTLRLS